MDQLPLQKKTYLNKTTLFIILSIFALASYFILPKAYFWDIIDFSIFKGLNRLLMFGKPVASIVAFLNHRIFDFVLDFFYLYFMVDYIKKMDLKTTKEKFMECLFITVWIAFCILVINRHIFRYLIDIEAISPSLKFKDYFHINHILPSFKTKVYSHSSFPGDHATTAFLFYFLTQPIFQKKFQLLRRALLILALLPRLIVGAHNVSDILIGSSILSFVIYLLFHKTGFFEKVLKRIFKKDALKAS